MTVQVESKQGMPAVCGWVVDRLERHAGSAVALALLAIFLVAMGESAGKLLWFDELVTVKTALLPNWSDVWNFYNNGLDTTGPLPSLIARAGLMLPTSPELTSRLPFTLAYLVMCFCMYAFVHRRYPVGYALAVLIYTLNYTFFDFAIEARAYAVVLGGCGIAMRCWQSAVSGKRRPWNVFGLWLGLAFAMDAHAFAIFLLAPFALAQLAQDLSRRKLDLAVWAALILSPAGLVPVLHGELLAKKAYGNNFWSQPDFGSLFKSYADFVAGGRTYLIALVLVAIAAALFARWNGSQVKMRGFSMPEWTLVVTLALLPVFAMLASYPLHVYVARYALCCNIGMVVCSVAAVAETARRSNYFGVILLLLFLFTATRSRGREFVQGVQALVHPGRVHEQLEARYNDLAWIKNLEQSNLPIVTGNVSIDMQFDFYARPGLRQRLQGVTDLSDLKSYPRSTTFQLNLFYFGSTILPATQDIATFVPAHPDFFAMTESSEFDWLPRYLAAQQAAGQARSVCLGPENCTSRSASVYEVKFASGGGK